ncbi:MAG: hypothetical protein EOP34_03360 [Rickettsiales bacterium]|nr:MAG: hypothetical protein EOP34_03360 [Rickettsiales bacterium]
MIAGEFYDRSKSEINSEKKTQKTIQKDKWIHICTEWKIIKKTYNTNIKWDYYTKKWLLDYLKSEYDVKCSDKIHDKNLNLFSYLCDYAEKNENLFAFRTLFLKKAETMDFVFSQKKKEDYFYYMLCSFPNISYSEYHRDLNKEMLNASQYLKRDLIGLNLDYLLTEIANEFKENNLTGKQFIILFTIYMSKSYCEYWVNKENFLANPEKFFFFVKNALTLAMRKLQSGEYSDINIFLDNVRPCYNTMMSIH